MPDYSVVKSLCEELEITVAELMDGEETKKTGYPLHYIKDAKHFSNGDNPEQVNSEIALFIKKIIK